MFENNITKVNCKSILFQNVSFFFNAWQVTLDLSASSLMGPFNTMTILGLIWSKILWHPHYIFLSFSRQNYYNKGSISLICLCAALIPPGHKSAKRQWSHLYLLGPVCVKAEHKTLVKLTPGANFTNLLSQSTDYGWVWSKA